MIPGSVLNKQSLWEKYHPGIDYTPTAAVRIISQRFILENLCAGSEKLLPRYLWPPTLAALSSHAFFCLQTSGFQTVPFFRRCSFGTGCLLGWVGWGGVGPSMIKLDLRLSRKLFVEVLSFSKIHGKNDWLGGWRFQRFFIFTPNIWGNREASPIFRLWWFNDHPYTWPTKMDPINGVSTIPCQFFWGGLLRFVLEKEKKLENLKNYNGFSTSIA